MNQRYHVKLGSKRTTVSLDKIISDLLCLKADIEPGGPKAHGHVKYVLQAILDRSSDDKRIHTSQWLQGEVILQLVDKKLSKQYDNWILSK